LRRKDWGLPDRILHGVIICPPPGKAKRLELRLREQGTVGAHRRARMGRKATLLGNQGGEAGMGRALDGR